MTGDPYKVVFDCNVFFQALISPNGPAGSCLNAAEAGDLALFVSNVVIEELRDVCHRPRIAFRFKLTAAQIDAFTAKVTEFASLIADVPRVFEYDRDPDDAHYINLALAAGATLVVSRDKDLLALRDLSFPESRQFAERFPDLRILTPSELFSELEKRSGI